MEFFSKNKIMIIKNLNTNTNIDAYEFVYSYICIYIKVLSEGIKISRFVWLLLLQWALMLFV